MFASGTLLNQRYEISAMAHSAPRVSVYRAVDLNLGNRAVMVSVVSAGAASSTGGSPEPIEALVHEARRVAAVEHPNLVPVSELFEHEGQLVLVSPCVEGAPLVGPSSERSLGLREAVTHIDKVAQVLECLHGQEPPILVRSLRPDAVVIDRHGQLRVADIAVTVLSMSGTRGVGPTTDSTYLAPELLGGRLADPRSDVYALGAFMFSVLTGESPPPGIEVLTGDAAPAQVRVKRADVPAALEAVVMKALAARRDERYATVFDVRVDLARVDLDARDATPNAPTAAQDSWTGASATAAEEGRDAAPLGGGDEAQGVPSLSASGTVPEVNRPEGAAPRAVWANPPRPPKKGNPLAVPLGVVFVVGVAFIFSQSRGASGPGSPQAQVSGSPAASPGASSGAVAVEASPGVASTAAAPAVSAPPSGVAVAPARGDAPITALHVESVPPGAKVFIDSEMVQGTQGEVVTPMTVAVTPGRHTVMLGLDGYEPTTISVRRVTEHTTRAINVSLGALTRRALPSATPTPSPPRAAASVPYPTYTETPRVRLAAPPAVTAPTPTRGYDPAYPPYSSSNSGRGYDPSYPPYKPYPAATPTPTPNNPLDARSIPLDAKINVGDPTKDQH